jgi:hypothetical protein
MDDLLARLDRENLSILVLHIDKELYRSARPGVQPLLELVDKFPQGLPGATVIDRVVGGCAARVFVHLRVARVLTAIGSTPARAILAAHDIDFRVAKGVLEIRNRNGTDACPFEQLSRHYPDPEQLIPAIRRRLAQLRA